MAEEKRNDEQEYGFALSDIVSENKDRVKELMNRQRSPEEEQEFMTLVSGVTNQRIKDSDASRR